MPHRVEYRPLANHLSALSPSATCADLAANLAAFRANDAEWWAGVLAVIRELPPAAEWLVGLWRLCELLWDENRRFDCDLLTDWILDVAHKPGG